MSLLPERVQVGMQGHTWRVVDETVCATAVGPVARRPQAAPMTAAASVASPLWRLPVGVAPKPHLPAQIDHCNQQFLTQTNASDEHFLTSAGRDATGH